MIINPYSFAAPFNPLTLSPALWLSDTGSDPAQWDDLSGNGRHATQSTGTKRPSIITAAINGRQVRRFDGADDGMLVGGLQMLKNVPGATIIIAGKWITNPTSNVTIFNVSTGASPVAARAAMSGGVTSQKLSAGGRRLDADAYAAATSSASMTTNPTVFGGVFDYASATATCYLDGAAAGLNPVFQTAGNTSNTDSQSICVGATNVASNFANIDLAEIFVFPTALSGAARQNVERYLGAKYGISVA